MSAERRVFATACVGFAAARAARLSTAGSLAASAVLLAACAPGGGDFEAATGAPLDATAREEQAVLARGELLSFACRACHGLAPGDESPIGPPLHGMFGRAAAAVDGFDYSPVLRESGIVWTEQALDAWLAQPNDFLPGNNMAFAGFRSAEDRKALIRYLRERTAAE